MQAPDYECSECGYVCNDLVDTGVDICPECGSAPLLDEMKWLPSKSPPPIIEHKPQPPRYVEEITACFNCEDGTDFLVVARNGQGFLAEGSVYAFVQDRSGRVWQITGLSSSGFFHKKLVLHLRDQYERPKKAVIHTLREVQPDRFTTYVAMEAMRAASGVQCFSSVFQWTPLNSEDAKYAWAKLRWS